MARILARIQLFNQPIFNGHHSLWRVPCWSSCRRTWRQPEL